MIAKIFWGRKYYKPWVELFGISPLLNFGNRPVKYFDSTIEDKILELFSKFLGPGGKIYVECEQDIETLFVLTRNFPIPVSRLGFKLFKNGFTWFKDWYFPEGYLEGGRKLQGEKPLDEKVKLAQIRIIKSEIRNSLKVLKKSERNEYIVLAKHRANKIIS